MNEDKIGFLSLARYGDVINSLPIAKHYSTQAPVDFLIAPEFAPILEGVSYVNAVPVPGLAHSQDTVAAMSWAAQRYPRFVNAQVYNNPSMSRTRLSNFLEEQYYLAGVHHLYSKEPILFDRRDFARERHFLSQFDLNKPIVAYNLHGQSTPMDNADRLEAQLVNCFGSTCTLINTTKYKTHRIFDLLGLFDVAKVLITIDTATSHLSRASKVPTIELTRHPGSWVATPKGPNCVMYLSYADALDKFEEIKDKVRSLLTSKPPVTWHLVNTYKTSSLEEARRMQVAAQTWQKLYAKGWQPCHVPDEMLSRSSKDIGDTRKMPFIRDLVEIACARADFQDVIVLTNNDTCLVESLPEDMANLIETYGCALANRWDFPRLDRALSKSEIKTGQWYCGLDIFVFTKSWWLKWGHLYPDMLLGCEAWDLIMKELMYLSTGSESCVMDAVIYHEKHDSFWERPGNKTANPGQVWARKTAHDWLLKYRTVEMANWFPQPVEYLETVAPTVDFVNPVNPAVGRLFPSQQVVEDNSRLKRGYSIELSQESIVASKHVAQPIIPPAASSPVSRGQVAPQIKAKVRTPDGSRVHLFHG